MNHIELAENLEIKNKHIPSHEELLLRLRTLAKNHPDKVKLDTSGKSREGRELIFVEIGSGDDIIAVTAGAHSDEPFGIATSLVLIENLLENRTFSEISKKYKFVFHPMLDPDGAALNYRWAQENLSYSSFLKHNYRNNMPSEDCEHGIPVDSNQGFRPELQFFKKNIDRFKNNIKFYITLHTTSRLGGSMFVVNSKDFSSKQIQELTRTCDYFGLPVMDYDTHGEDGIEYIAPGFLKAPLLSDLAKKYQNHPDILSQLKMSTYEYLQEQCGCKTALISELPFVFDKTLTNYEKTETPLSEVKKESIKNDEKYFKSLEAETMYLEKLGYDETNLWFKKAKFTLEMGPKELQARKDELEKYSDKFAQALDVEDLKTAPLFDELRIAQLKLKVVEKNPNHISLVKGFEDEFDNIYEKLSKKLETNIVPLDTQIRIQSSMILSGAIL